MAGARARHRATPPLSLLACPPLLARCPGRRHALPPALSHSPSVPPSSPSLPLSRPDTIIAAVRHSSRPRPPLAPPTSSGAPPRLPLPPHRSTGLRKPCIAATSSFPSSGSDHHRRRIRRLQRVSEPASTPTATAVSPRVVSPFSPGLFRPLGLSPTLAESSTPPAMSPSWPRSP